MKHTPEPWKWVGDILTNGDIDILWAGDDGRSYGMHSAELIMDNEEADKARIVSCVNACAGINPEALPAFISAVENLRDMKGRHNTVIAYDRLMEALAKLKPTQA